jgi:hypothetical protein
VSFEASANVTNARKARPWNPDTFDHAQQLNSSGKPLLGRSDILGTNSTGLWPGGNLTRSPCSMVATTNVISAMANVLPMQILGPPPKGK